MQVLLSGSKPSNGSRMACFPDTGSPINSFPWLVPSVNYYAPPRNPVDYGAFDHLAAH